MRDRRVSGVWIKRQVRLAWNKMSLSSTKPCCQRWLFEYAAMWIRHGPVHAYSRSWDLGPCVPKSGFSNSLCQMIFEAWRGWVSGRDRKNNQQMAAWIWLWRARRAHSLDSITYLWRLCPSNDVSAIITLSLWSLCTLFTHSKLSGLSHSVHAVVSSCTNGISSPHYNSRGNCGGW